jgi:hypothetical protein
MKTAGIRPDDIVRCDVRGQRFYAKVNRQSDPADRMAGKAKGFWLDSLDGLRPLSYRFVTARQIIEHYSKRKG